MLTSKGIVSGPDTAGPDTAGPAPPAVRQRLFWRRSGPRALGSRVLLRVLAVLTWICLGAVLFVLLYRISVRSPMGGDNANLALQGWEMLHGNLLLHGWILGDVTYYTFELPLYAIVEALTGLHTGDVHLEAALAFVIVAALAVALARTDSRGLAAAARSGVVIFVLATPLILAQGVVRLLEVPDHFGTSVFLLGSFLLIDKAAARWFTAPAVGVILFVGQIGDATVRYIAVPAVLLVCAYRVLAARKLRTYDTAVAVAAAASVPLSMLARAAMRHAGSYAMLLPRTEIAPAGQWAHQAVLMFTNVREVFGAIGRQPHTMLPAVASVFAIAGALAAGAGFVRVILTWRRASRAEQMLCVTIVIFLAVFTVSEYLATYEISGVLACGAVLAARVCVPARMARPQRTRLVFAAAVLAAILPLALAADRPPVIQKEVRIAAWLDAHGLRHGLAWYWDASPITVLSGGQVQVRAVQHPGGVMDAFGASYTEAKPEWYNPRLNRATFVIAGEGRSRYSISHIQRIFGRPAEIYHVDGFAIVSYRKNLLVRVARLPIFTYDRPAVG
jgi:hypothetical protein